MNGRRQPQLLLTLKEEPLLLITFRKFSTEDIIIPTPRFIKLTMLCNFSSLSLPRNTLSQDDIHFNIY